MEIEITFENDVATFNPTMAELTELYWFAMLSPDGDKAEEFSVNQVDTLPVLNRCEEMLKTFTAKGKVELNRKSLLAFIDEAVTHKEYCTADMLYRFDYFLYYSLWELKTRRNTWVDATYQDIDTMQKGLSASATATEIKDIYDRTNIEKYICRATDVPTAMLIQVAFSLMLHLFKRGQIIKRCDRCGKLFIPTRASDKYCQRKTNGKTCGEIRKEESQKRSHDKEEKKLYKRIDNRLLQQGEYSKQDVFRTGFRKCKTVREKKAYLKEWNEKTYKKKPEKSTI